MNNHPEITSCPDCRVDRVTLIGMLEERPENELETENHATARILVDNCASCRKFFGGLGYNKRGYRQ